MKKKNQKNVQPSKNIDDIIIQNFSIYEDDKQYIENCESKIIDGEKMYYCSCGGYLWYLKKYEYFICGHCRRKYYK